MTHNTLNYTTNDILSAHRYRRCDTLLDTLLDLSILMLETEEAGCPFGKGGPTPLSAQAAGPSVALIGVAGKGVA